MKYSILVIENHWHLIDGGFFPQAGQLRKSSRKNLITNGRVPEQRARRAALLPDGDRIPAIAQTKKRVLRGLWGKSELTVREAGKLVVAKPTIHLSLLSPCILLILP
ncbi:hypothetical protein RXP19_26895, partial [Pseudomonas aeruginosa]|nr:hypothetical protein [Pseudomonas aeruginosa]MEB5172911.1 hypothetical protein [Pseudomonas aeruginosa]